MGPQQHQCRSAHVMPGTVRLRAYNTHGPSSSLRGPAQCRGADENAEKKAGAYFAGSNMHCSVGLAIVVKVGPISACLEAGTQSFSMVGTPVSLMPRSSAIRRSRSSTRPAAWSCRQPHTSSGCAHLPSIWGAHWRTNSQRGSDRCIAARSCCDTCAFADWFRARKRRMEVAQIRRNMMGLQTTSLDLLQRRVQRAATTRVWDGAMGEPL